MTHIAVKYPIPENNLAHNGNIKVAVRAISLLLSIGYAKCRISMSHNISKDLNDNKKTQENIASIARTKEGGPRSPFRKYCYLPSNLNSRKPKLYQICLPTTTPQNPQCPRWPSVSKFKIRI